ncbi:hypothetical protein [Nocardia sp. NPDC019395]|uniref:hypothetical protein n=1 Tax=Nocardia sp. NPDC019395 TaxID=3154686 RepID=UPI0033EB5210
MRLQLSDDAYDAAPSCWWSRERWIAHNLALYDQYYVQLRRRDEVESVARKTFTNYLQAESAGADYRTGRNSRVTIDQLKTATSRERSTVLRCRRLVAAFGTRTTVFTGRHRTRDERIDSWRRGDRARGWASVSALHESATLPVDNSIVENLLELGFGTPPERSEGSVFISGRSGVSSSQNEREGSAPRHIDKRRVRRAPPVYDQKAVKLVANVRRDERFPLWVRLIPRGRLTAAVTRKARADWDVDDVYGAFEEHRIAGRRTYDQPRNPAGYLVHLLRQIPDDMPPARLDRAREVAEAEAEHAHWRRELEAMRQARTNSSGMNPTARAVRDQLAGRTHGHAAARARQAEYARREIAARDR